MDVHKILLSLQIPLVIKQTEIYTQEESQYY